MKSIFKTVIWGLPLILIAVNAHAATWSADIQVGDHTDIINLELEYDPATGNLFAVVCWDGDGCTSFLSDDLGEHWGETFAEGPGATVNDISCLYLNGYFYVTLATPLVLVLYRFDPVTGAQVDFGSDPFLIIYSGLAEEVVVTTPDPTSNILHIIAHDNLGKMIFSSWDFDAGTSIWYSTDVGADRGLDAASCLSADGEDYSWVSFISDEGNIYVYRYRWFDSHFSQYYSLYLGSTSPHRTSIALDGSPGTQEKVFCVFEYLVNPTNLAIVWSPDWLAYFATYPDSSCFNPDLHIRNGEDIALAYTQAEGLGPSAPTNERFVLYPLEDDPVWFVYQPREVPGSIIPDFHLNPDIVYMSGEDMYGLLHNSRYSPDHAYFTRRTPGCCGTYTGGGTGNANCSDDGKLTLSDISRMIDFLYISKADLCCYAAGNTNGSWDDGDCKITLSDISKLIDALYISKQPTADCMPECER